MGVAKDTNSTDLWQVFFEFLYFFTLLRVSLKSEFTQLPTVEQTLLLDLHNTYLEPSVFKCLHTFRCACFLDKKYLCLEINWILTYRHSQVVALIHVTALLAVGYSQVPFEQWRNYSAQR